MSEAFEKIRDGLLDIHSGNFTLRKSGKAARQYPRNGDFDLHSALFQAGFTQAELADRLGVHPNTVSKWMTKQAKVPGPVIAYLTLYLGVKGLLR